VGFQGLEEAAAFYHVNGRAIAYAALAGPLTTLLIAVGALMAAVTRPLALPGGAHERVGTADDGHHGIYAALPGWTMTASDEAIAAHFSRSALSSFYWPSLVLAMPVYPAIQAVEKGQRFRISCPP